ncbi:hypothetical protein [Cognaticolwellia aestuarii]|uniref:hypothetical protein n=1 Tax=Cognaticolwellia aestuarii TaxID=329993 RepID=UPI0009874273|nr:hypothetical protein [Cognaticolwellia aestuarii]
MKDERKYLFDDPKNIKRLLNIFYLCCVVLVILDFVIHRHTMHEWDSLWAFYPIYGFVGCVVLVLVATWMRKLLMRSEDYYDSRSIESVSPDSLNKKALSKNAINEKGACHVDD